MRSTLRDVQVAVRIRPLLPREVTAEAQVAFWRGDADGIEVDMSSKADKDKGDAENEAAALYEMKENGSVSRWSFMDALYGPNTDNRSLFSSFVLPLISCVMDGQNCSILAYGQTASGKTFSIFGSQATAATSSPSSHSGIIYMGVQELFRRSAQIKEERAYKRFGGNNGRIRGKEVRPSLQINLSVVEIYSEVLSDLLVPAAAPTPKNSKKKRTSTVTLQTGTRRSAKLGRSFSGPVGDVDVSTPLSIVEDATLGITVKGARVCEVHSPEHAIKLLSAATSARSTNSTKLNAASSRSHVVVRFSVERFFYDDDDVAVGGGGDRHIHSSHSASAEAISKRRSVLNIVDLVRVVFLKILFQCHQDYNIISALTSAWAFRRAVSARSARAPRDKNSKRGQISTAP